MSDDVKKADGVSAVDSNELLGALCKRVPFEMVMHMNCGKKHYLHYLNVPLNVCVTITTPYRNGKPGKGVKEFGVNVDGSEGYATLAELLEAQPELAAKAADLYPPDAPAHLPPIVGRSESERE